MVSNFLLKVTLLVFTFGYVYSQCLPGEIFSNRRCFRFINEPMPHERARLWCDLIDYYLVSINNAFENAFLGSAAYSNLNTTGNFWIGLEKWRDGNWYWAEGDTMPVNYLNWQAGEPNPQYFTAAYQQSTNQWVAMDNATFLPFVCATNPIHNLTTPGPGATTPSKTCAGTLGLWDEMGICYEAIWGDGWNEGHDAEESCAALGHKCHMVSIQSEKENDFINKNFGGFGYIWIGLVGNSTKTAKWTDGSPMNFTNWANPEGVFKTYKCTSGDCCGVMVPNDWFLYGDNCGEWFLEDCVKAPDDLSPEGTVCKSPYY